MMDDLSSVKDRRKHVKKKSWVVKNQCVPSPAIGFSTQLGRLVTAVIYDCWEKEFLTVHGEAFLQDRKWAERKVTEFVCGAVDRYFPGFRDQVNLLIRAHKNYIALRTQNAEYRMYRLAFSWYNDRTGGENPKLRHGHFSPKRHPLTHAKTSEALRAHRERLRIHAIPFTYQFRVEAPDEEPLIKLSALDTVPKRVAK